MALFISLGNWTQEGIRNVKQTTKRVDAAKKVAAKHGVTFKEIYYTIGKYDFVAFFEAPDAESLSRFALAIGAQGNVHTLTMQAFTVDEMKGIVSKL
jgi:uncharacterized protein with GYD domain